jgi:nitroreductase
MRRSIRKFADKEIARETIERILEAGILAPSAKNAQPWKFVVVTNKEKPAMLSALNAGLESIKNGVGFLPSAPYIKGFDYSIGIMEEAPVTVFVFNTAGHNPWDETNIEGKLADVANIQSIGACIENMLIAATDLGLGSLWICDVFISYREICRWLNEENQLVAAVSFGYADENPSPRPRKKLIDVIEWR